MEEQEKIPTNPFPTIGQPIAQLVVAEFGQPVNTLTGPVGTEYTLRVDFKQDSPSGETQYLWEVSPPMCLENVGETYVPDFKRKYRLKGDGEVKVQVFDANGFYIYTQTVKVSPSS
jgi:hypothetical protein